MSDALGRGGACQRAVLGPRGALAYRELADAAPALVAVQPLTPR